MAGQFGSQDAAQFSDNLGTLLDWADETAENKFLSMYNDQGILQDNPFEVLDVQGLGQLIEMTVSRGRAERPDLEIGICGEQGGQPASIRFCHHAGLNYVSCSAPRVPVARLAAANVKLREHEYKL